MLEFFSLSQAQPVVLIMQAFYQWSLPLHALKIYLFVYLFNVSVNQVCAWRRSRPEEGVGSHRTGGLQTAVWVLRLEIGPESSGREVSSLSH